ncbi:MAG: hypothetical protein HZB76_05575 [Chlamydiae bacterium]|nr:hypothetical protein [Chlamydiota bacterium]
MAAAVSTLREVLRLSNLIEFAGRVIVYHTSSKLYGIDKGYTLETSLLGGMVGATLLNESQDEDGYPLFKIIKPSDFQPRRIVLTENNLTKFRLSLRLATVPETEAMFKAILARQAVVNCQYFDKDEIAFWFKRHVTLLEKNNKK